MRSPQPAAQVGNKVIEGWRADRTKHPADSFLIFQEGILAADNDNIRLRQPRLIPNYFRQFGRQPIPHGSEHTA